MNKLSTLAFIFAVVTCIVTWGELNLGHNVGFNGTLFIVSAIMMYFSYTYNLNQAEEKKDVVPQKV